MRRPDFGPFRYLWSYGFYEEGKGQSVIWFPDQIPNVHRLNWGPVSYSDQSNLKKIGAYA